MYRALKLANFQNIVLDNFGGQRLLSSSSKSDINLCYLNSIVQLLYRIQEFRDFIITESFNISQCISVELQHVFIEGLRGKVTSCSSIRR